MIFAHVGGVPVEEMVPSLIGGGAGAGLLLARAWLKLRLHRSLRSSEHAAAERKGARTASR